MTNRTLDQHNADKLKLKEALKFFATQLNRATPTIGADVLEKDRSYYRIGIEYPGGYFQDYGYVYKTEKFWKLETPDSLIFRSISVDFIANMAI